MRAFRSYYFQWKNNVLSKIRTIAGSGSGKCFTCHVSSIHNSSTTPGSGLQASGFGLRVEPEGPSPLLVAHFTSYLQNWIGIDFFIAIPTNGNGWSHLSFTLLDSFPFAKTKNRKR